MRLEGSPHTPVSSSGPRHCLRKVSMIFPVKSNLPERGFYKHLQRVRTTVVAACYLLVSTRRMNRLVETLGITGLSKSQVSVMAKELDVAVEAFRSRPLDARPYTFVAADALVLKVRKGGRVVNVHALIATGVNAEGWRPPPQH